MGSITTVNDTGFVINVTTSAAGINSSIRNSLNPGEFYVHSAVPGTKYALVARYYSGPESLFESNWEELGKILAEAIMNLAAIGVTIVTFGAAASSLVVGQSLRLVAFGESTWRNRWDPPRLCSSVLEKR